MPMNCCPNCGKEYAPHSAMCPPCNYWFTMPDDSDMAVESNKKPIMAFAGAGLLLVGLFTPLVGFTFFTVNYYNLSQFHSLAGLGFFLLLLCGVSGVVLAATKRYELLRWPGLASLLIVAYTFFTIQSKLSEAKTELSKSMASMPGGAASSPFGDMGGAVMSMIQMQWGWGLLAVGGVLMIVAGMLKNE